MQEDLNNALIEVRKAYRLLADYQKKVLDLVDFIGNSFGRNYSGGFPKFGLATPRNGKGSLDLWSWDWLNMYYYSFNFGTESIKGNNITFAIFLISDTGYYDEKRNNENLDKRETENFNSAELSETKLIFLVGKNKWDSNGLFAENFNKPDFVTTKQGQQGDNNNIMVYKSYSLSHFLNQDEAEKQLKDFEDFCKGHDIIFNLKNRTSIN